MGLVSKFWTHLDEHYAKLKAEVTYVRERESTSISSIPGSTLAIAMDAMELLYVRTTASSQAKLETLEGYEMVLLNTIVDMLQKDVRITALVFMFDKETPTGKNAHNPRHNDYIADPVVATKSIGEQAWFESFKITDSAKVQYINGDNRVNTETRLEISSGHMANRGFKQFLITLFCNGLRKKKDVLMTMKRRAPLTICVRGHGSNNFELYWDNISDSVQLREPTLSKAYYQEAEMGMSAAVCDLISLGYSNIAVISNDGDTFGPLALTIPKRTDEHGTSYVAKLYWLTRYQMFDVNAWHILEERWCQSLGLDYGVYFTLVHYVALIVGGGNDYVQKINNISAKFVIRSLDKETYANLLHITQTDDKIKITLDETAFERLIHESYAKKHTRSSKPKPIDVDAEKIGEMYRGVQWYLDYMVGAFVGEPTAFPPH